MVRLKNCIKMEKIQLVETSVGQQYRQEQENGPRRNSEKEV